MTIVHTIAKRTSDLTDTRVFFRRPDETIYAVLTMDSIRQLRKANSIVRFLAKEHDSGVVIKIARA